jgi:hypothetical protein
MRRSSRVGNTIRFSPRGASESYNGGLRLSLVHKHEIYAPCQRGIAVSAFKRRAFVRQCGYLDVGYASPRLCHRGRYCEVLQPEDEGCGEGVPDFQEKRGGGGWHLCEL